MEAMAIGQNVISLANLVFYRMKKKFSGHGPRRTTPGLAKGFQDERHAVEFQNEKVKENVQKVIDIFDLMAL